MNQSGKPTRFMNPVVECMRDPVSPSGPQWEGLRDALRDRLRDAHDARLCLVMGILNVTPDSFSDGGRFATQEVMIDQARRMLAEGVDIFDVGGESTRPGSAPVDEAEERRRVEPAVATLCARFPVPVSIDTYKAATARAAIGQGAVMVNDVWGFARDPLMAETVGETGALAVIMHNRETVDASLDIFDDMRRCFDLALGRADRAGVPRAHLVLDPGVGFGKTDAQNLACIRAIDRLRDVYDLPVLLGLSRKSFLGRLLNREVADRLGGTLGAGLFGAARGAAVLRVHDVGAHVDALRIRAILKEIT